MCILQALCNLFSTIKIGVSAPYFNKKCDEFGAVFDEVLRQEKASDENCMQISLSKVLKKTEKNPVTLAGKSANSEEDTSVIDPIVVEVMAQIVQSVSSEVERKTFRECNLPLLPECKYVIDNFNIFQRVRTMTEENQNKDTLGQPQQNPKQGFRQSSTR